MPSYFKKPKPEPLPKAEDLKIEPAAPEVKPAEPKKESGRRIIPRQSIFSWQPSAFEVARALKQ